MQCTIDTYAITDGTFSGGVALSDFRLRVDRIHDVVTPLGGASPVYFNRLVRKSTIDFVVARCHASAKAAEQFLFDHEFDLPSAGTVALLSEDGSITAYVWNARLFSHQLNTEIGSTTMHAYHIEGGPLSSTPPPPPAFILTEGGDNILTESGDKIEMEQ